MRRVALLLLVVLAGCGGHGDGRPATAAKRPAPAELVSFQRNGGAAATLDKLTVRADGVARLDKRYGGAGRRYEDFALTRAALRRLRADLDRLPARLTAAGTPTARGATYILRYGGRSYTGQEGAIGKPGRAAFALLNALIDGGGRGRLVKETRQGPTTS